MILNPKNKNTFIIAEAGVNHNGKINIAKKLIISAKKAGADAIKFQIFDSSKLSTKNAKKHHIRSRIPKIIYHSVICLKN